MEVVFPNSLPFLKIRFPVSYQNCLFFSTYLKQHWIANTLDRFIRTSVFFLFILLKHTTLLKGLGIPRWSIVPFITFLIIKMACMHTHGVLEWMVAIQVSHCLTRRSSTIRDWWRTRLRVIPGWHWWLPTGTHALTRWFLFFSSHGGCRDLKGGFPSSW